MVWTVYSLMGWLLYTARYFAQDKLQLLGLWSVTPCTGGRDFGLLLGFELNQLKMWDSEYRGNAKKCWNEVMNQWLTQGGSRDYPATWEGLYTLLSDTDFPKLVQKLKNA